MGFLNDFINNIKNKFAPQKTLPEPYNNKINVFSDVQQQEDLFLEHFEDLYESQNSTSIHSNIATRQSAEFSFLLDMAYVAATADYAFYIPHPYKVHHYGKDAQKFQEKYAADLAFFDEYLKKTIKVSKKLDTHSKSRLELVDEIKKVYPDFCMHMDEKISPEDYAFYRQNKVKLKKAVSAKNPYSDEISLEDQLLEYQDNLAQTIDTIDFSRACEIEDRFVLSELNTFFEKYDELSPEEQAEISKKRITIKTNGKNKNKIRVLNFAHQLKDEREARIEKYHTIEELYSKLENQSKLRLNIKSVLGEDVKHIDPQDLSSEDDAR